VQKIGVLSTSASGWAKELNLISWNDREPKYDLRLCRAPIKYILTTQTVGWLALASHN
jgi:hypothetical protein